MTLTLFVGPIKRRYAPRQGTRAAMLMAVSALLQPASADVLGNELLFADLPSVYEESKYRQKVSEAPGWISVVTAEEIQRYGHRTLVDILDSVPGFFATYDRTYPAIGVRGFGDTSDFSTRLLLMIDGVRTNDGGLLDTASIGRHFLMDVNMIERVEISRGPGTSLYGSNAITAVVNIMTKRGRDFQGISSSVAAGSNNTVETTITGGKRRDDGIEYLFSINDYQSDGNKELYYPEYDFPEENNGVAENLDGETDRNVTFKLSKKNLTLQGAYSERRKDIPTGAYGSVFNAKPSDTEDTQYLLSLKYNRFFGNDIEWRSDVYAQKQDYFSRTLYNIADFDAPEPDFIINTDESANEWYGFQSQVTFTQFENHRLTIGADGRYNAKLMRYSADRNFVFLDDERSSSNWGIYAQNQYIPRDNLQLFFGLRYDQFEGSINEATPRLGLVYQPASKSTLKVLYSNAFRAPNVYDLYSPGDQPQTIVKNDLDGERIDTYELVLEQQFNEHWMGVASLFYYELGDIIEVGYDEGTGEPRVSNLPDTITTQGLDLAIDGKLGTDTRLSAGITYQATEGLNGDTPPNSPATVVKLGLLTPVVRKRLLAGFDVRHTSERDNLAGFPVDGFTVTNLTLRAPSVIKGLDVDLNIYNLFDTHYSHIGTHPTVQLEIPQDKRQWRVKLRYRF